MPIYVEEGVRTLEDLEALAKKNCCSVCGSPLAVFMDWATPDKYLACFDWPRTNHEGIERGPSRYEMGGLASLNIPTRREIMVAEYGETKTKALEKYQGGGKLSYTGAVEVLKLVYPRCPEKEIIRTAMLCRDFGLHPLMKEVYLIPFNKYETKNGRKVKVGEDWATVIGITANRKIASALKGAFSFLDDTPRAAGQEEIIKQYGPGSHEARDNIISICRLRGEKGNTANGWGLYPKTSNPYGTDKGNTPRNMANIRAERQALDRLPGGAMPFKNLDVIDEAYAEAPPALEAETVTTESGEVNTGTGEIIEAKAEPVEDKPEHWCEEHNCEYDRHIKGSAVFYSHKHNGGYCNEIKPKKAAPAPQASTEPSEAPGNIDADWLRESLIKVKWDDKTASSWLTGKFKIEGGELNNLNDVLARLTVYQVREFVKEIESRLEMA